MRIATSELVDGIPCALGSERLSSDAKAVADALKAKFPKARVLMRGTGRYVRTEVVGATPPKGFDIRKIDIPSLDDRWRLDSVAFRP